MIEIISKELVGYCTFSEAVIVRYYDGDREFQVNIPLHVFEHWAQEHDEDLYSRTTSDFWDRDLYLEEIELEECDSLITFALDEYSQEVEQNEL